MAKNSHIIRILGTSEIAEPLKEGMRYLCQVEADLISIEKKDNHDESYTYTYKLKNTGKMAVSDMQGKIIKADAKKSNSQKLHGALWYQWSESGQTISFEDYYKQTMSKIILYLPDILEYLKTKA